MITQSNFKPAWWLRNRHVQTMWPSLFRRRPFIQLGRERVELPDGDFIDLEWTNDNGGPVVILLHGLEGNLESHYVKGLLKQLHQNGFHAVLMYFRGCGEEINRLPRAYHSGETTDINFIATLLKQRFPGRSLNAIGISLGGNVLLKWLGEQADACLLSAAVAISVPFDLALASKQLNQPESSIYQRYLVNKLQRSLQRRLDKMQLPINTQEAQACSSIWCYDDHVTAPLHGFKDAQDYYTQSSSRAFLKTISIPTLIIHAVDDPFMTPGVIPTKNDISDSVMLELSEHGGHVGFIAASFPFRLEYWLEKRVCQFLGNPIIA